VSAKQYALCIEDGVCRLYCQKKAFATGECQGTEGWDCKCSSRETGAVTAPWEEMGDGAKNRLNDEEENE
jgi:hypothetical protein